MADESVLQSFFNNSCELGKLNLKVHNLTVFYVQEIDHVKAMAFCFEYLNPEMILA